LLPLHVGGDLPRRLGVAVERHLAGCAACRAVAAEVADGVTELRHLMAAATPRLGSVRAGVVREIVGSETRRRAVLRLRVALAATAALAVASAAVLLRGWQAAPAGVAPPAPALGARATAVAPVPPPAAAGAPAPSPAARPTSRMASARSIAPAPTELARGPRVATRGERPMKITLLTDDPEVVIYWLVEPDKENADG